MVPDEIVWTKKCKPFIKRPHLFLSQKYCDSYYQSSKKVEGRFEIIVCVCFVIYPLGTINSDKNLEFLFFQAIWQWADTLCAERCEQIFFLRRYQIIWREPRTK